MMDWIRNSRNAGVNRRPILKNEIEEAQRNTKSGAEAARWLNTSYLTYRKYARLYGIFEQHKNPSGKGMAKPHRKVKSGYSLTEILEGKHPNYDVKRLKKRLINAGILDEECSLCGFSERRILDYRVPLILCYKDGSSKNHKLENLVILCFNCAFLTTGNLNRMNPHKVKVLSKVKEDPVLARPENDLPMKKSTWEDAIEEAKRELEAEE